MQAIISKDDKENQFTYDKIGNWWHKDVEIDLIAINEEKEALFMNVNGKMMLMHNQF